MSITSESGECFGERKKKKKMKAAWLLRSHCGQAACVGAAQLVWWRAAGARHLGPRLGQVRCGLRGSWQAGLAPVGSLFPGLERVDTWQRREDVGAHRGSAGAGGSLVSVHGAACPSKNPCTDRPGHPAGPCAGRSLPPRIRVQDGRVPQRVSAWMADHSEGPCADGCSSRGSVCGAGSCTPTLCEV